MQTTHTSSVTRDQIDHLGHMNVRFYGVNARAGLRRLLAGFGVENSHVRVADVYTRHLVEQMEGAALETRSGVLSVTPQRLDVYHELANAETGTLAATFVHGIVPVGETLPVDDLATLAQLVTVPAHGAPRSISLATDPLATAPGLDEAIARGMATRRARTVGADECDADGEYLDEVVSAMTWIGEQPDGRPSGPELVDGPNGERMGWATMENRVVVNRLPRLGDRIQAFGGLAKLTDKISHQVRFVYDLERGDLLTSSEVVNLAFDTISRRSMVVPGHVRERELRMPSIELQPR